MNYFMGIDGGASSLRVVLTDADLQILADYNAGPVNPRLIGYAQASAIIQAAIRKICQDADVRAEQVTAVGIGIAGADTEHSRAWLDETLHPLLSNAHLALSSDYEIALVGALGQREGILILAGTGSAGYGRTADGRSARIGGWGYVLGDEGSGYWIGLQALKLLTRQVDKNGWNFEPGSLAATIPHHLKLASRSELLDWIYGSPQMPVQVIATLAPLVIEQAESGNPDALDLVQAAARALAQMARDLRVKLNAREQPIAFAGGLLSVDNALSRELCRQMCLSERPIALYSPVVGAAYLALLSWKDSLT